MSVLLVIPGEPMGKGSVRSGGPGRRGYTDPATRAYMDRAKRVLAKQWAGRAPLDGPVAVGITVVFPRPDYLTPDYASRVPQPPDERIAHVVKPDLDNVIKMVLDCATKAGIWSDDARVCRYLHEPSKWWAAVGEEPGVDLVVASVDDPWATWALHRGPRPEGA